MHHTNTYQKKAGMVILVSDKTDFRTKKNSINEEGHNDNGLNSSRGNNPVHLCI